MNPVLARALKNFPVNYQTGGMAGDPGSSNTLTQPNWTGLGMVGAYLGSNILLDNQNNRHYQAYKNRWIRDYQIPSLIQQPNKFGDQYTSSIYKLGGRADAYAPQFDLVQKFDDGGGLSRDKDYGSSSHPYPGVSQGDFAGPHRSYPIPSHADAVDALRLAHLHGAQSVIAKVYAKYPDLRKKLGGMMKSYQMGSTVMDPNQMAQFNRFNEYVRSQGYGGSDKLNHQAFSRNLYSNFQKQNPDVQLSYDQMIPMAQQEQYNLKSAAQGFAARHGTDASQLMSKITPQDAMYGPKTSTYDFPNALLVNKNNNQVTNVQNLGLVSGNQGQIATPQYTAGKRVPKGAQIETLYDANGKVTGQGYVNDQGDIVELKKGGNWIAGAVNPAHKGYCTPMTKSTCTGRRRAFAETMKKHHGFHEDGGEVMKKGGHWIQGAVNPKHKGYCTPMSKSTCTPHRKALARRFKAMARHQDGGITLHSKEEQQSGYFGHPQASYLHFPGQGNRTFVPGPFPLAVMDDGGVQILDRTPIRTRGAVTEIPIFEQGGEVTHAPKVKRSDATIEAEKGELIFGAGAPGDYKDSEDRVGVGLYRIGGKKHSQGGTPLKAYPGDFVFSNDPSLSVSEDDSEALTGKKQTSQRLRTPAKLAGKYTDLNKFIAMAQDKDVDPISKKTAILNVNNFMDRLGEIAYAQEEAKGFPTGLPAFAQASLQSRGYNQQALQASLNQGPQVGQAPDQAMRQGGEVQKYQLAGTVTDAAYNAGTYSADIPKDYKFLGTRGNRNYYMKSDGTVDVRPAPASNQLEPDAYKLLRTYGTRETNNLSGYSYDDLIKGKYLSQDNPQLRDYWNQYYKPQTTNSYMYNLNPVPPIGNPVTSGQPFMNANPTPKQSSVGYTPDQPMNPYSEYPNQNFNPNVAELYGIYAANKRYPSRYPSAYRTYEIQNAESLVNDAYSPISEQPYLNAIRRQTEALDASNISGPVSYARGLASRDIALNAEQQAISQVYAQNQGRKDQRAAQLAQLELQNGADRVQNQSLYENKLETLAQNKETEAKGRVSNNAALLNQMVHDRESKGLFNAMSQYYEIGPNNQLRIKPTYKIENGKITQVPRSVADMIKGAGQTQNAQYMNTLEQVFRMMQRYGITNGSFVDDVLKQAMIPPRPGGQ